MRKFFIRIIFLSTITLVLSVIYLSFLGIETDKFDDLIKNRANEVNKYVKLGFKK